MADQSLLSQLTLNLTENAIMYGRPHGHAALSAQGTPDEMEILVRDDGIVMRRLLCPDEQSGALWRGGRSLLRPVYQATMAACFDEFINRQRCQDASIHRFRCAVCVLTG